MKNLFALLLCCGVCFSITLADEPKFDLAICNGRVVDGTGAPWYEADVGIQDGKIVLIGSIDASQARKVLDASGLIVAPGFIDMMGQNASPMLTSPEAAMNLLTQGITTINAGEGGSAAPLTPAAGRRQGWTTFAEYFALLDMQGFPVNVAQTVGHTQVRELVIGDENRRPSDEELGRMKDLVREGMEAGAIGLSTALIYPPAIYAPTEEISQLAEVAGQHGGRYYTHIRNEGDRLLEAIDEAIEIGRSARTPVHIFHLKAAGQQNWSKMQLAISKIKAARVAGQQVTADIYPYINNGLDISALIHPRHFENGLARFREQLGDEKLRAEVRQEMETSEGWENWFRHVGHDWERVIIGQTNEPHYRDLAGQSVAQIAKATSEEPWDTFFTLVSAGAFALPQSMTESNLTMAMQEPFVSFCTDVGPAGGASFAAHPRASGAFPRLFARYVRQLQTLSLERAVAQASAVAANEIQAYDRGRIALGLCADLVVFDEQKIEDKATFAKPSEPSVGVQHVIVNGQLVLEAGKLTAVRPGRVLRGPGYKSELAAENVATGKVVQSMQSFDELVHDFMKQHHVPGVAVAVTDHGRLVFVRGYGYADLATRQQVQPDSLFRIASISKPITALAIMQLVERGKLDLEDRVFDVLDYAAEIKASGEKFDERMKDIRVRHLLEHRGGWDNKVSFDAMFQSVRFAKLLEKDAPADQQTVIRAMLTQRLDFAPGERFAYSNFGYCLLGRIIEKVSGDAYQDYVQENVLKPIGIRDMQIGATHPEGRLLNEVRYYHPSTGKSVFEQDVGQITPWQYGGFALEPMDSHGGWLASAVDLAKLAIALDNPDECAILSAASIQAMKQRPDGLAGVDENGKPRETFYSIGWQTRVLPDGKQNQWHTGSLPGTATILIRRHDGKNFVALMNTRVSPTSEHLSRDIDPLLHRAAAAVSQWPTNDLLDKP